MVANILFRRPRERNFKSYSKVLHYHPFAYSAASAARRLKIHVEDFTPHRTPKCLHLTSCCQGWLSCRSVLQAAAATPTFHRPYLFFLLSSHIFHTIRTNVHTPVGVSFLLALGNQNVGDTDVTRPQSVHGRKRLGVTLLSQLIQ